MILHLLRTLSPSSIRRWRLFKKTNKICGDCDCVAAHLSNDKSYFEKMTQCPVCGRRYRGQGESIILDEEFSYERVYKS